MMERSRLEFDGIVLFDTARRLDFSDDGPSWSVRREDGTISNIFAATPEESCESSEPTLQAVVVHNTRPDGQTDWEIATFIAPHPGSFTTDLEQKTGFWDPLESQLEPISAGEIDRELNLRYFAWKEHGEPF